MKSKYVLICRGLTPLKRVKPAYLRAKAPGLYRLFLVKYSLAETGPLPVVNL
jgi:hypothetical protein